MSASLIEKAVTAVFRTLERMPDKRRATKYLTPSLTVKLTRRHTQAENPRIAEFVLTVGRPNSREREFIMDAIQAGELFPIKKVHVNSWPKRRS